VSQVLTAPERLRRDAPVLPTWGAPIFPVVGFEGRSGIVVASGSEFDGSTFFDDGTHFDEGHHHEGGRFVEVHDSGVTHDEYGVPHEEVIST
jgi:hypothetical protein